MKQIHLLLLLCLFTINVQAQVSTDVPAKIDKNKKYLFYLHGAIVQAQGENAVSPKYGKYQYRDIVNALSAKGYYVISEVRQKDATVEGYAKKVSEQVKALLDKGVPAGNIAVAGASMGASIATQAAIFTANKNVRYVVMGMCDEEDANDTDAKKICGNFLSIYESSDGPQSCERYLKGLPCVSAFKEVKLDMGNAHGFLYQPYKEWMEPLVQWIGK